jgi:hypothetical protein
MNFETWWKEVGREWAERQFDGKGLIAPPCLNLMEEAKTLAYKVWEAAYVAGCRSVVEAFTPVRDR